MGGKRKLEEPSSSESTEQVWLDDDTWKWNNPDFGQLYMEEGECQWTNRFMQEDERYSICFEMSSDFEEVDGYDWESTTPPLPNAKARQQMKDILARQDSIQQTIAKNFLDDWHGKFPNGGMWWSNSLETVREDFDEANVAMPKTPDELEPFISLSEFRLLLPSEEQTTKKDNDSGKAESSKAVFWVDFGVATKDGKTIMEEEHDCGASFDKDYNCIKFSYSYAAN
mmetsp:Transcript_18079/g.37368  ORF Transcript_18079/g.37368 Transcript_18079/m.37368 type:complete len:226 (-) Transcript_18079:139-816(-)